MPEREKTLIGGLQHIRELCRRPADAEGIVRKVEQFVGMLFKRAGVADTETDVPLPEVEGSKHYLVDLGSVQLEGQLDEESRLAGRVWINDTEVLCDGMEISLVQGEQVKVNLLGVIPNAASRQAETPDHAEEPAE